MPLTDLQYERETTIVFNDAEDDARLWSAQPSFQRKMKKLNVIPIKTMDSEHGRLSYWYLVPKSWIKVKRPTTRKLVGVALHKSEV